MAASTTLSSASPSPSLHFINGSRRYVSATPLFVDSFFHHRRIRRLKRSTASYHNSQSRRRYEADGRFFGGYEYDVVPDDDDFRDQEDGREISVDLLIRFLRSMFKKVSKRAKKASQRILPAAMSPRLVSSSPFKDFINS